MTDGTRFEQDLSAVIGAAIGPGRPIDAMAITRTAADASSRRFDPVFKVLQFGAGATVVALFGALLITGSLGGPTQHALAPGAESSATAIPADPRAFESVAATVSRADVLSGVELEVEPLGDGVYKLISDGHRRLSDLPWEVLGSIPPGAYSSPAGTAPEIIAGMDGSILVYGRGGFFRIGDSSVSVKTSGTIKGGTRVAPDGTIWGVKNGCRPNLGGPTSRVRSFAGLDWTIRQGCAPNGSNILGLGVSSDGSVWVWREQANRRRALAYLDDDRWRQVRDLPDVRELIGVRSGQPWFSRETALVTFDGDSWLSYHAPEGRRVSWVDTTPDGDIWALMQQPNYEPTFYRFDGETWHPHTDVSPMPLLRYVMRSSGAVIERHFGEDEPKFVAAPDSVWYELDDEAGGIVRFDGETTTPYLAGWEIHSMDVDPTGRAWVRALPNDEELRADGPATFLVDPHE